MHKLPAEVMRRVVDLLFNAREELNKCRRNQQGEDEGGSEIVSDEEDDDAPDYFEEQLDSE